jgi:anti-sigma regulatory factor (Ser/Thr protein kinase)
MAPSRPTEAQPRQILLAADPRAAAQAREHVRVTIAVWDLPVDPDTASLLVSELVTNAVTHDGAGDVTMAVRVTRGRLRVDVHDTSPKLPRPGLDPGADAEAGRGLLLVDTLADEWGYYRTEVGKAVYFTLVFRELPGPRAAVPLLPRRAARAGAGRRARHAPQRARRPPPLKSRMFPPNG